MAARIRLRKTNLTGSTLACSDDCPDAGKTSFQETPIIDELHGEGLAMIVTVDDKDKILRYVFSKCHINFLIHILYKYYCCERENKVSIVKIILKTFNHLCGL